MAKLLYCDLTNGRLRRSLGGAEFNFGTIPHIGTISMGLRFSQQVGTRHVEVYPDVVDIRALIGPLDERPEAGQFSLLVGSGPAVEGTNATGLLDYDCSAEDLQEALSDLDGLSAATVVDDDGTFVVRGVAASISVLANTLRPITFVRVWSYEVDGETVRAIRLQRAPYAYTDSVEQRVPRAPYVERLQAGGEVEGVIYPEIQKIVVPLEFSGNYRIRRTDPLRKSGLLGVADGPEEIAAAINPSDDSLGLADDAGGVFEVVEHPTEPASVISFRGTMEGNGYDLLEIEVFDPPPADHWIHLNPHTPQTEEALRATNELRRVPIELHATLQLPDDDQARPYCLYRGECTIVESIAHEDLGEVHEIDWINPPSQRQYPPVSPDSLASGSRYTTFLLGNGADVEHQIQHDLDSPRVRIHLRENVAGGRDLVPGTDYEVVHDSDNACTITFLGDYAATPPEASAISGTAQDLSLTSSFDQHAHTIDEVDGLQAVLDALAQEIAEIKAGNFGGTAPMAARVSGQIERALPRVWWIPRLRSMPTEPARLLGWDPYAPVDGQAALRERRLLPAVHLDPTGLEILPTTLPAPSDAYVGRVFYTPVERPDLGVPAESYVACNGIEWYRVARESEDETTWYPTAFNTELFRFSVSPDELVQRARLDLAFGFEAVLHDPSRRPVERRTRARMTLLIERGVRLEEASPATTGSNIDTHFADPVVLVRHDFDLSAVPAAKRFSLSIARDGNDVLTALAGKFFSAPTPVSAPETADFALRARLCRCDIENLPADARGLLAVRGLDVGMDGNADPGLGRYVIF